MGLCALIAPTPSSAQAGTACPYDSCALRVRSGIFAGQSLVQGEQEEKVAGLGFIVGDLDDVFEGSTEAQELAARFRTRKNTGTILSLVGIAAFVYSIADYDSFYDDELGGAFYGGLVLSLAGGLTIQSSTDFLSRAVWHYNRTLARSP